MTTTRHPDADRLQAVSDDVEAAVLDSDLDSLDSAHEAADRILGPLVDPDTARAMSAERTDALVEFFPEMLMVTPSATLRSVWLDAFTLGVLFQQRGGHVD